MVETEDSNNIDFFSKNVGKLVHVDFLDFDLTKRIMMPAFIEGTLKEVWDDLDEEKDLREPIQVFVVIENDTDFVQISKKNIRRIYLKEKISRSAGL